MKRTNLKGMKVIVLIALVVSVINFMAGCSSAETCVKTDDVKVVQVEGQRTCTYLLNSTLDIVYYSSGYGYTQVFGKDGKPLTVEEFEEAYNITD